MRHQAARRVVEGERVDRLDLDAADAPLLHQAQLASMPPW